MASLNYRRRFADIGWRDFDSIVTSVPNLPPNSREVAKSSTWHIDDNVV